MMSLKLKGLAAILGMACLATSLSGAQQKPGKTSEVRDSQIKKLSFDLNGVTLRQALSRIADDSGAKFWAFRRYADGIFEITLSCC